LINFNVFINNLYPSSIRVYFRLSMPNQYGNAIPLMG